MFFSCVQFHNAFSPYDLCNRVRFFLSLFCVYANHDMRIARARTHHRLLSVFEYDTSFSPSPAETAYLATEEDMNI